MAVRRFLSVMVLLLLAAAAARSQVTPGNCLRYNGTNGYVSVPHAAALNAYPLTVTAWVRTLRSAPLYDGIVNKYAPGSGNGYSFHVYNGRLRGWYIGAASSVYPGDPGFDGGFIADGQWHHVAMVIGPGGGTIYIDGVSRGTPQGWSATPTATTTTQPITIGRYATSASVTNTFAGDMDEVGIWNRALSLNELNYLKHRRLNGNEDGLLSLWHFDEGTLTTSADATPAGRTATLNGAVAWKTSAAPIALSMIATNCLRFDGVSGYVSVTHNTNLNAYPLTAAGWFRTTNTVSAVQGIVSKYADGSGNGWSLFVTTGKLRGFFYRPGFVAAIDATSAAVVADGGWHHAALTVDAAGGKLWLDGSVVGTGSWASPGPPTNSEPVQIGRYHNYAERFQGALDEITVWNRALTTNEIQTLKNRPLAGNEANLLAYWRLDEGTGTSAGDATGHGYDGAFVSTPAWTGSTAYLGDGSVHFLAAVDIPFNERQFAVTGGYQVNAFGMKANATFWRFYDFGPAPSNSPVAYKFDAGLQIAPSGVPVAVKPNTYSNAFNFAAYNASTPVGNYTLNQSMNVEPAGGVQLDSVNNFHQITATLSHSENGGGFSNDGTEATDAARLLHFNGHVFFGSIDTILTNVINTPTPGTNTPPTHLASQLQIGPGGAYLATAPGFKFGGSVAFTVNLGANGFATNLNGSFSLANPTQFFETNGIRYRLPGATLSAAGMVATNLEAWFPQGFGMSVTTNSRVLRAFASKTNVVLGPDLLPTTSPVVFTAASYNTNRLWFADDTKPFWIGASQIEWRIPQGEFFISEAQSLQFVRQKEDDDLAAQRTNLVDQLSADRISNDGYYRSLSAVAGVPVYVRPDANGGSLLTMQATMSANEYRPHFPYLKRNLGGHIPVTGGALAITNDFIDRAASYLSLGGPVPVPYARDCAPESGCGSVATNGPQVLSFTTATGQLGFTPEGGLLAYGNIPPANLTWGFVGGTAYAQRTSDVSDGAYYISGTFLHADDFAGEQEARRPLRLLHTGYGDSNDVTYAERPGQANYADGLANYAGLNFRAPAQGRSVIAGTDTGLYPLTPRSKYYVRFGGVSGIHESASFPTNLTLYGYAFTFQSYRLSFLGSENIESRTDGVISLPVPSGFPVEFERMKFLCRGNLDSARLPANIASKHLVYWNTDLSLLSLQFRPRANDVCSLTNRYLVLGVETKLPFIVETNSPYTLVALHATLAIKANGNLATAATGVEGVDSRFAVPANLRLQGPGESSYPITTAGDGYFNNWETTGHPATGFYSLAGRVRVPFFQDIKTHFHVTPSSPTNAQVDMMGGWPAEEGKGENRGWNNGTQNYFTTPKFDANADGWPVALVPDYKLYRKSPDTTYRQRAQQNWINVAVFDYPLAWDSLLREFSGFSEAKVILPVIDVDSRLKQVTPGKVDFDFAQDLNLKLPRIKVLDFANDALNEINAPINSVSDAIHSQLGAALNTSGLTSGFRSLQTLMRENAEGFFRPAVEAVLMDPANNVVDKLYGALSNSLAGGKANLLTQTPTIVGAVGNGLQAAIQNLNGTAAQANRVFGQLDRTLGDVDATLDLFINVLKEKDDAGNRRVVRAIVQKLAQDQGLGGVAANVDVPLVNNLLRELEPTLAKIESELRQLRADFSPLRSQLSSASSDFAASLNAANHNFTTLPAYVQQAGASLTTLFSATVGPAGDYFRADPARAKREIRERLTTAFLGSAVSANYQTAFRQFLYDKNALLTQLTDVLFDQVNRAIRNALRMQLAGAQDGLFQGMKGGGAMGGSFLSAKIRGAPTFEGDSLRRIHLDSEIKMNLPDEMKFSAYLDIKELTSQSTALSCIPVGGPAAEVTLGAKDIPLDWLGVSGGGPLKLNVEARWTLQDGAVLGIGGSFEVIGKIGFKGCSINNFGASLAIGRIENYFAAKAGATVTILGIPVDFNAGIFAGHACSVEPLKFIDPEAEEVLIARVTEFTGVYLQFGAQVSLSDIIFGSSSCVLDVTARVDGALYYQGGPRLGSIGGRQKIGVSADVICIISAEASWATGFRLDSEGKLTLAGKARLCGKIGACPFCLKACATLAVTGVITDGGVDYSIDY